MRRRVVVALAAVLVIGACGSDDSQPLVKAPPLSDPQRLYGEWTARQPGGYTLRYVFRPDGTYRHFSGTREQRPAGTYTYAINAAGDLAVRGDRLVLRPRRGTQVRHDPADPKGDYERPVQKLRQRYRWAVRGQGRNARLTLTIGGGLVVTFRRP